MCLGWLSGRASECKANDKVHRAAAGELRIQKPGGRRLRWNDLLAMSWAVGFDSDWNRDVGYGVPAICDFPGCETEINRGLSFVCGAEPFGGEHGCGLYFCSQHQMDAQQRCERCSSGGQPFVKTPDVRQWIEHKLSDESWRQWRDENPEEVDRLRHG